MKELTQMEIKELKTLVVGFSNIEKIKAKNTTSDLKDKAYNKEVIEVF